MSHRSEILEWSKIQKAEGVQTLPSEYGFTSVGAHCIAEGLNFITMDASYRVPVRVVAATNYDKTPLILRVNLSACDMMRFPHFKDDFEQSSDVYNIHMAPTADVEFTYRAGGVSDLIGLAFDRGRLQSMFDGHKMPKVIQDFISDRGATCMNPRSSHRMRQIAAQMKACSFAGAMRDFYLYGKTFELLSEVLGDFDEHAAVDDRLYNGERRRALEARDILLSELAHPPSLEALAQRVGTTPRKLNKLFREVYGTSVFERLAEWRLDLGRSLLIETNLTVKEIGFRLGYGHTPNFVLAFARRFRTSPHQYRKQRGGL